ncbi:FirrV-1-A42 [Feldmannia irregularis virus a]|uniref:FirrV-1-A42 n=1 Tax=Feldmannia irregularis virus a TaxID=231992 RepID=Q6XM45_9PHYC|nr:FirrV-1-A42 [Feldmannia irregularis virus a]AAR26866.1 FirrV-1-A42 [Feldmannia irregularis virus a]
MSNNKVRYPFTETHLTHLTSTKKKNKRTQRYRSTAKSRICGMTVGDIRYCFQQLRNANADLCPDFVLYNGQCAGEFALSYLIETSNSMKKKRQHVEESSQQSGDGAGRYHLPASQLTQGPENSCNHIVTFL